ncbi:MAG TPA: Wzz/FepE/Etk N-terminal domain-containing protein [Acidobacteriota bacterium]|nr:Wzz/FepE/Etk N-terminal domain-containing protein [Acidobacteriota bacterium]
MKDLTRWELRDYLAVPWKRRWFFLAAMILVFGGTAIFARLRPNLYRSETRILVESATLLDDNLSPNAARDRTEDRMNTIRQLLESRTILERVVEEFNLRAADSSVLMEDRVNDIRNYLEISKSTGNIFTMAYIASSPQVAQAVAKRLANILIDTNRDSQKEKAADKDEFMEQELSQAQKDLGAIDEKISQFKARHLGELPEQATANMNLLSGLNNQLVAIENALDRFRDQQKTLEYRIQEQRTISELAKSIVPNDKSASAEAKNPAAPSPTAALLATKRSQLAEAESRFTAKHPDVIRLRMEVADLERQVMEIDAHAPNHTPENAVPQNASGAIGGEGTDKNQSAAQGGINDEAEIARAKYELDILGKNIARKEKEREETLKNIDLYKKRLNLAPALEQELLTLMREHDGQQKQVENLGTRKFNTQIAANAVSNRKNDVYRILDEASLPERPIPPTRLHIILIGIAASLLAGYGMALGREVVEPSLSNEDEATAILKLPVLASIPEIAGVAKK